VRGIMAEQELTAPGRIFESEADGCAGDEERRGRRPGRGRRQVERDVSAGARDRGDGRARHHDHDHADLRGADRAGARAPRRGRRHARARGCHARQPSQPARDRSHGREERQGRRCLSGALPRSARVVSRRVPPERGRRLAHAPVQGTREARAGDSRGDHARRAPGRRRHLRQAPGRRSRAPAGADQRAERRPARRPDHACGRGAGSCSPRRGTERRTAERARGGADQQGREPRRPSPGARDGRAAPSRPAIQAVVLAAVRAENPVLEVCVR